MIDRIDEILVDAEFDPSNLRLSYISTDGRWDVLLLFAVSQIIKVNQEERVMKMLQEWMMRDTSTRVN